MEKLNIAHNLYKQYLSGKYCDLSIQVDNATFQAHSCVIAAASWVLEAILQSPKPDEGNLHVNLAKPSIQLHGVTAYAISALLSYIYTGKLNPEVFVDNEKHREILHAAKLYKLDEISEQLVQNNNPVTVSVTKSVDDGTMGPFQMLEGGQLNEVIFDKFIPSDSSGTVPETELHTSSGQDQINIILNDDTILPTKNEGPENNTSVTEAQEHVSHCFKYSKDNGILFCILCCEMYSSPDELLNHMAEHRNETRRRSGISRPERAAAVAATAAASLALTGSGDVLDIETPRKRKKLAPKKSFVCMECGLSYTTKVYLVRHYTHRHPGSFFCQYCGDHFLTSESLQEHMPTHDGERGDGKFGVKALNRPKSRGKTTKKVFSCNLCETTFGKKRDLIQHQQIQHGIVKPMHVCTVCGKEFKEKASLRSHNRVHTGEKPYMCSYCGNSFADQKTWKDHERRHRGEKPFLCTTCGKSFTYRQSFTRHMKFHEGKRPFQCSFCGKAFVLRQNLKEHEKRHTK